MNAIFNPLMDTIWAFFPKNQGTFFIYKKGQGRPPPSPAPLLLAWILIKSPCFVKLSHVKAARIKSWIFAFSDWDKEVNLLSANPTKWSSTLKQFVGNLPTNCLSVFDYFVKMALKGLSLTLWQFFDIFRWFWEAGNNFN